MLLAAPLLLLGLFTSDAAATECKPFDVANYDWAIRMFSKSRCKSMVPAVSRAGHGSTKCHKIKYRGKNPSFLLYGARHCQITLYHDSECSYGPLMDSLDEPGWDKLDYEFVRPDEVMSWRVTCS